MVGRPPDNAKKAALRQLADHLSAGRVQLCRYMCNRLHYKMYLMYPTQPGQHITGHVGSSNLTYNGLANQGELSIPVNDLATAADLQRKFEAQWQDDRCVDVTTALATAIRDQILSETGTAATPDVPAAQTKQGGNQNTMTTQTYDPFAPTGQSVPDRDLTDWDNTEGSTAGVGPGSLLEDVEFAQNREPRCPLVILVDVSGSMSGTRIAQVNRALSEFGDHIRKDTLTALRTDIAVVAFNHETQLVADFTEGMDYQPPPPLSAKGGTKMGNAVLTALNMVETRKKTYRDNGLPYYRAFVMMLTDGKPEHDKQEEIIAAANAVQAAEAQKNAKVVAFGIAAEGNRGGADIQAIQRIVPSTWEDLISTDQLPGALEWLANSMESVSQSQPGDEVALPNPNNFLTF